MKKMMSLVLILAMALCLLAGCDGGSDGYKVAIVQQMDHPSLDEIRIAIENQLNALASEKGITLEIRVYNGQNDLSMLNQIGAQVVSGGYDIVIPIATNAAQVMVSATEGTDMPVVFAAVSDPDHAGLTGFDRVTGTSDALNTPFILDMMLAVQPDVKTVGLLYSTAEPNSATAIAEAKAYLDAKGIAWLEKTGNNADEILAAAGSLTGRVEAVFTPTDNCIMAVEPAVAQIFTEAGIAHYTGADSFVAVGAFATCGVNYTQLGTQTGTMAMDILQGARIAPYHVMAGGIITVNKTTAQALGLDYAPFAQMAIELVEVE